MNGQGLRILFFKLTEFMGKPHLNLKGVALIVFPADRIRGFFKVLTTTGWHSPGRYRYQTTESGHE